MYVCVYVSRGALENQRCEIPLQLKLQVVVRYLIWMLGIELLLYKNCKHSSPLSQLPSLFYVFCFVLLRQSLW